LKTFVVAFQYLKRA